jgi:hypothetical protein
MADTQPEAPTTWPYWSLFLLGNFGSATPASRRLNQDSLLGLAILLIAISPAVLLERTAFVKLVLILGAAIAAGWVLLAYRRYFAQLDELSLRIQHEAIAFSFMVMMLLGFTASFAVIVTDLFIHPAWFCIAEPVRGLGLVIAARKYR